MPSATTLRAVPSTTRDAVFGHNRSERSEWSEWRSAPANHHAPRQALTRLLPLRRRVGISSVAAPPRYARYRLRRAALDLRGTHRRWVRRS